MSVIEDIELTEEYKLWVDECAKLFGGLDICALYAHSISNQYRLPLICYYNVAISCIAARTVRNTSWN